MYYMFFKREKESEIESTVLYVQVNRMEGKILQENGVKMKKGSRKVNNNKKLTAVRKKQIQNFNIVRAELHGEGYNNEKSYVVSFSRANLMALMTIPIVIVCFVLYLIVHRGNIEYARLNIPFYLSLIAGVFTHELIHGITWAVLCKKRWRSIGFGVNWRAFTPYCHCKEALTFKKYALGSVMPTMVLGVLPYSIGLILGNYYFSLFGMVFMIAGGGDAYILWLIRKEKNAVIIDHPYLAGCVALSKQV